MVDPFSRIVLLSLLIIPLIVTTISSPESQPKQRSTVPAVLFNPKYGTHKSAMVNGIRLHYVEAGDRIKPLMVFLHGFPDFWYSWRYQIPEFSKDYWTVAVDMRGFGFSEKPIGKKNYVMNKLIKDVKALVKYLNRKTFVLVGHDWGAYIGSVFVAHYPEMVQKYILMGSAPSKVFKQLYEQTADQRNKSSYMITFLKPGVAESEYQANDFAQFSKFYNTEDVDVYKYVFSQPGGKDPYISQLTLSVTAKQYPKMRIKGIPNAKHFVHQDEPEITNKLIRDFLDD